MSSTPPLFCRLSSLPVRPISVGRDVVEESSVFGAVIIIMNVYVGSNSVKAVRKQDVLFADVSDNDEAIMVKNEDNW